MPPAASPAGAENSYNLFAVRRNADAATDEDRSRLQVVMPVGVPLRLRRAAVGCVGPATRGIRLPHSSPGTRHAPAP